MVILTEDPWIFSRLKKCQGNLSLRINRTDLKVEPGENRTRKRNFEMALTDKVFQSTILTPETEIELGITHLWSFTSWNWSDLFVGFVCVSIRLVSGLARVEKFWQLSEEVWQLRWSLRQRPSSHTGAQFWCESRRRCYLRLSLLSGRWKTVKEQNEVKRHFECKVC